MPISREDAKKLPSKTDEARAREILEAEFNTMLPKKRLKIGNISHEFDLYSDNKEIIGEVKSGKDLDNTGKIKRYRFAEICLDCLFLMSVNIKKKILVLIHKEMFDAFLYMTEGFPLEGIDIRLIELENPQYKGAS